MIPGRSRCPRQAKQKLATKPRRPIRTLPAGRGATRNKQTAANRSCHLGRRSSSAPRRRRTRSRVRGGRIESNRPTPREWVAASVPLEAEGGAPRHVELAQLGGTAEIGQIDDEASGEQVRAQLAQQFHRALRRPASGD